MLDALIFDFDGVVVDSEPIHLACFRQVLGRRGIDLPTEDYYGLYLGFDDHDCFEAVLKNNHRPVEEDEIAAMTAEKTALVQRAIAESIQPLPGALELMRAAREAQVAVWWPPKTSPTASRTRRGTSRRSSSCRPRQAGTSPPPRRG